MVAKKRINGFQLPFGIVPLAALAGQVVSIGIFVALVILVADTQIIAAVLGIYCPILAVAVSCWIYCQGVDPAVDTACYVMPCLRNVESKSRYCSQCKKMVPGLDHHCKWLNTCIGKRNYFQFYVLVTFGCIYSAIQFIAVVFLLAYAPTRESGTSQFTAPGFYVWSVASLILSAGFAGNYMNLWFFHNQLLRSGQGTYDYLLEERQRYLEEKRKAKQDSSSSRDQADNQSAASQLEQGPAPSIPTPNNAAAGEQAAATTDVEPAIAGV